MVSLALDIDKCSTVLFGKKSWVEGIRESINENKSLKIFNQPVPVKQSDIYLGDVLHEGGLAKSVMATVDKRYGRIFSAIIEVSKILEDYRIDVIGGLSVGLEIFELAVIPSLLNNAETWTEMNSETETKLESLQNLMFRHIFAVPMSTPKPILRWDLGQLSVKEKIHIRKLCFLHHLKNLPSNSLGAEFYELQVRFDFPGLIKECKDLLREYRLPDITEGPYKFTKEAWKNLVKKTIKDKSEKLIKVNMTEYSKLKNLNTDDENLKIKDYIRKMTLRNARTKFRIRSQMLDVKMNKKI